MASDMAREDGAGGGLAWIRRHPRVHRNINRGVAGMFVAFGLGLIWLWGFSSHPLGLSLPYLVTYGMVIVSTIVSLLWLVLCSKWPRSVVWGIAIVAVVTIGGLIASVRRIDFNGDMRAMVEWRWEPTQAEMLRRFRESSQSPELTAGELTFEIAPEDMPVYRGTHRDGQVVGPRLNEDWSAHPPRIVWKHPVGGGYAQPVGVGNLLVTIEQREEGTVGSDSRAVEAVVCYDAATGGEIWVRSWPGRFDEAMGGPGPRATPTIANGRVYALGAKGHLECIDLVTGQSRWARELLKELGLGNSEWGMASPPLVLEDRIIVNVGGHFGGGLMALNPETGDTIWQTEGITATKDQPPAIVAAALKETGDLPPAGDGEHASPPSADGRRNRAGYAAPVVVTVDGEEQILNFDGLGLWGHAIDDGRALWFHRFENGPGVNAAQPVVFPDGRVFISASYSMGCRMLKVAREGGDWRVDVLWGGPEKPNRDMKSKMSSPVLIGGYLYGLDEGMLTCLDPATGERLWKKSRQAKYGHGQLLTTNGQLLVFSESGELVLIDPHPEGLRELGRFPVLEGAKNWNPPALMRGRAYVRNHHEMACVELCGP